MIARLFLDMDNTIAENQTCQNIPFTPGLYLNKRPIQIVLDAIQELYPVPIVIISKPQGGTAGIQEKLQWLQEQTTLQPVDFIFLQPDQPYYYKAVLIDQYCQQHDIPINQTLIIDDSKQVLQYCQAYNIQTKYPQQVICDYEATLRKEHTYGIR